MTESVRSYCILNPLAAVWLSLFGLLYACASPPPAPRSALPSPTPRLAQLAAENTALTRDLEAAAARIEALEQDKAELERRRVDLEHRRAEQEIRILQKEAAINELERRMLAQQHRLDDAITEVVRTKAKLRSIESKAEAASTIAEAEIAVKALRIHFGTADEQRTAVHAKAAQLLAHSIREFKARNYGGALYLAIQAKNQAGAASSLPAPDGEAAAAAGENAFGHPLSLVLAKNTNLRDGPALTSSVLTTLKAGTKILGYSYRGDWIRVAADPGTAGWVHQSLVTAR